MEHDDRLEILKERSYEVTKGNEIIQRARYSLSVTEQKIFCFLVSKIKPDDKPMQVYTFSINEYCRVLGIEQNNGKNGIIIRKSLKALRDKSFELTLEDGTVTMCGWVNKPWISEGSGKIRVRFDDDVQKYLVGLLQRGAYTQYQLLCVLPMRHSFSIRLYELLRSYSFQGTKQRFNLDEIKKRLACEYYKRFPDFRRKVLEPATMEINMYTDLEISWEPITKGRKVIELLFTISQRDAWDRTEAYNRANNFLDNQVPGQRNLFEYNPDAMNVGSDQAVLDPDR